MEILNEIYNQIEEHRFSKSSELIAQAVLSACNSGYDAPSFLSLSASLDDKNRQRMYRLINICRESDFNNDEQSEMIHKVLALFPELKKS